MARIRKTAFEGSTVQELEHMKTKKTLPPYHREHKQVGCKVPLEHYKKLKAIAQKRGCSMATLLRPAVVEFIENL